MVERPRVYWRAATHETKKRKEVRADEEGVTSIVAARVLTALLCAGSRGGAGDPDADDARARRAGDRERAAGDAFRRQDAGRTSQVAGGVRQPVTQPPWTACASKGMEGDRPQQQGP